MGKQSLTLEYAAAQPWGAEFVREAKLVAAANIMAAAKAGNTLYDIELYSRIAHFCRDLDGDLQERFLGIIDVVPAHGEPTYKAIERVRADIATYPRGHWAILRCEGVDAQGPKGPRYDAYISNGLGWADTESGNKFTASSPEQFTFAAVYATIFSKLAYDLRPVIYTEIMQASIAAAALPVGTNRKNAAWAGQTWSNFVYEGIDQRYHIANGGFLVTMSRRGRKTTTQTLPASDFLRAFGLDLVMPPAYDDPGNQARLRSLEERRQAAAQEAWDELLRSYDKSVIEQMKAIAKFDHADEAKFHRFASRTTFRQVGRTDVYRRLAYVSDMRESDGPVYLNEVTFAPDSDTITRNTITLLENDHARAA